MAISIIVSLVLINNSVYFYITKKTLEDELDKSILSLARQIDSAVEQALQGSVMFEEQISRELRAVSIASKYALDPDIEKVSNLRLRELATELDISHITLLKMLEDGDIILYRSSDPTQLMTSTKGWDPWYRIFQQLFILEEINIEWIGNKAPSFWSGPFEVSSTNKTQIYKWGYFFDGTTNYIIDPYVHYGRTMEKYHQVTGLDRLFENLKAADESILEISIVNPTTFTNSNMTIESNGWQLEHNVQRPILHGKYNYGSSRDIQNVKKAYATNANVSSEEKLEQARTYKMFIPVQVEDISLSIVDEDGNPLSSYVLIIVSDYSLLMEQLVRNFFNIGILTVLITSIMLPAVILVMRYFSGMREQAVQLAQDTYTEEINAMFQLIRSQRHDFINQVQTIHSLTKIKMYDELESFTEAIAGEVHYVNDFINIGNPTVAALIRSKISQADGYHIKLVHDIKSLHLKAMAGKTLDINRILGNLIDNAFDEVLKYEESKRLVHLYGREDDGVLSVRISNYCINASQTVNKPLFKSGFSSKGEEHHGLGLSIISDLVKQYKGELEVYAVSEHMIEFSFKLPV